MRDSAFTDSALDSRVSGESQAQASEIVAMYALRHNIDTSHEDTKATLNLMRLIAEESFLRGMVYAMLMLNSSTQKGTSAR